MSTYDGSPYDPPGGQPVYSAPAGAAGYAGYPGHPGYPGYSGYPGYPGYSGYPGYDGFLPAKSKAAAALLAFFLGGLGIHNFYLGWGRENVKGFVHIGLTVLLVVIEVTGFTLLAQAVDVYGNIPPEDEAAALVGAILIYLVGGAVACANGIWAFVEFVMILVSSDPRLR